MAKPKTVATICQWFARCTRPAVTTMPHPVIGDVPICQPCADKMARLETATRR